VEPVSRRCLPGEAEEAEIDWQVELVSRCCLSRDVDPTDFVGQEVPDVALDPQNHTVTLCNVSDSFRVAYVTIYETTVRGASGKTLSSGIVVDNKGNQRSCLTFIVCYNSRYHSVTYFKTTFHIEYNDASIYSAMTIIGLVTRSLMP
jgi:hypothetical protein